MSDRLQSRPNDAWVAALRGQTASDLAAVEELRAYICRTLRKALRNHAGLVDDDFADMTQEAMVKVLESLPAFRGDSALPTWATSIAIRAAFTELRRRKVRKRGDEVFRDAYRDAVATPPTEHATAKQDVFDALGHAIEEHLTDRQKIVILAELRGIPTVEIARRLETSRNTLYKIAHDGRKRLRNALVAAGYTAEVIHEIAEESTSA